MIQELSIQHHNAMLKVIGTLPGHLMETAIPVDRGPRYWTQAHPYGSAGG